METGEAQSEVEGTTALTAKSGGHAVADEVAGEIVHRSGIFVDQPTACSPTQEAFDDEGALVARRPGGRCTDNPEEITCAACRATLYGWWWWNDFGDGPYYLYCTGCESFQPDGHESDCPYVTDPGNYGAPLAHLNVGPIGAALGTAEVAP